MLKDVVQKGMILCFITLVFSGCATTADVLKAKDEGTTKIYDVNKDQAWKIAVMVFRWEGTDAIEQHKEEGFMLTSTSMDLITYGTVMGAWVEEVSPGRTSVTVVTKRRIATNFVTSLTETTFHNRFAQGVEIVKSGQTLPLTPPNYK